ncbi:MAG: SDR family NAD(P)-dependent oxidoreductase [Clostridium sp.]|nr:SDR family NAD(P)-dependent oxidoreductase [Clostridium sp.]
MKETVLLTGATGFLGGYVIDELLAHGYRVAAIGRNEKRGRELEREDCVFYQVDFTDREALEQVFKQEKAAYVIHAGALSSAWGKWEDFYRINVTGTVYVAELAMQYKVKRLVYISSPSVYSGRCDRFHISEDDVDENNRLNYYIRTKLMAEKELRIFGGKGLPVVALRPRGLIGKGDPSLMPRLMRANGRVGIPLFNGGKNLVDITCVENAAYACYLAMTAEAAEGQVFNITNGEPKEFQALLEQFCHAANEEARFLKLPFSVVYGAACVLEWIYGTFHLKGEPVLTRYTVCTLAFSQTLNIEKARERLHYEPKKTLEEGIREYGEWWSANQEG